LNDALGPERRCEFPDAGKRLAVVDSSHIMFPAARTTKGADLFSICAAPDEYVEIGLDGQISPCCRAQEVAMGYATSLEHFADVWLGRNYELIRASLLRGATGEYPLTNCEGCVMFFAPGEAGGRRAVQYSELDKEDGNRLRIEFPSEVIIEGIQKEAGFCHIVSLPLGLEPRGLVLLEDGKALGPADTLHDDIRKLGEGRYHIGRTSLYFSASDGSDARRNGRVYTLRRDIG